MENKAIANKVTQLLAFELKKLGGLVTARRVILDGRREYAYEVSQDIGEGPIGSEYAGARAVRRLLGAMVLAWGEGRDAAVIAADAAWEERNGCEACAHAALSACNPMVMCTECYGTEIRETLMLAFEGACERHDELRRIVREHNDSRNEASRQESWDELKSMLEEFNASLESVRLAAAVMTEDDDRFQELASGMVPCSAEDFLDVGDGGETLFVMPRNANEILQHKRFVDANL